MPDESNRTEDGDRRPASPEVNRFLADAIEKAGGAEALAEALHAVGFSGREGPFDDRTVRAWANGNRRPTPDLIFAVARLLDLSMDRYAFGTELRAEISEVIDDHERRLRLLERPA